MYVIKQLKMNLKENIFEVCYKMELKNVYEKNTLSRIPISSTEIKILNEYMTQNKKKFDSYLVNYDYIIIFSEEFHPHKKSNLQNNLTFFL